MPSFKVTAPTGEQFIINAPEGATEQDIAEYMSTNPQPKAPAPKPSMAKKIGVRGVDLLEGAKLTGKNIAKGLAGTADIFTAPIRLGMGALGIDTQPLAETVENLTPNVQPKTFAQKAVSKAIEFGAPTVLAAPAQLATKAGTAANMAAKFLSVNNPAEALATAGAGTGAALADYTENPYLKTALPVLGALTPAGLSAVNYGGKRVIGGVLNVSPEKVLKAESLGVPIMAEAAAESGRGKGIANILASTPYGRQSQEAASQATKTLRNRVMSTVDGATPSRKEVGSSVVTGLERQIKAEKGTAGALADEIEKVVGDTQVDATKAVGEAVEKLRLGDPLKSATDVNELMSHPVMKKINSLLTERSVDDGVYMNYDDVKVLKRYAGELTGSKNPTDQKISGVTYRMAKQIEDSLVNSAPGRSQARVVAQNVGQKSPGVWNGATAKEISDVYNPMYREAVSKEKDIVGRLAKDPTVIAGEDVALKKPAEETFRTLSMDLKNNPSRYIEAEKMLTAPRKETLRAGMIRDLGLEGNKWNVKKWGQGYSDLGDDSRMALASLDPELKSSYDTIADVVKDYSDVVGFAGNKERMVLNSDSKILNKLLGIGGSLGGGALNAITGSYFTRMMTDPQSVKIMAGLVKLRDVDLPIARNALAQMLNQRLTEIEQEDEVEPARESNIRINQPQQTAPIPRPRPVAPQPVQPEQPQELAPLPSKPDILSLLEEEEGRRDTAYTDTVGKRTVGIGFNMDDPANKLAWRRIGMQKNFKDVYDGKVKLTDAEIDKLRDYSLGVAEKDAKALIENYDSLPEKKQQAITQLSYQLGKTKLSKFDDMLAAINRGDFRAATRQLKRSRLAKQTPERVNRIIMALNEEE